MSEEQFNEETEVEGHGPRFTDVHKFSASDEPRDEAETDEEVEAHGSGFKVDYPKPS